MNAPKIVGPCFLVAFPSPARGTCSCWGPLVGSTDVSVGWGGSGMPARCWYKGVFGDLLATCV